MKFIINSTSKCSGRLGLLTAFDRIPDKSYKTPLLLFNDFNLSKEVLELAGFQNFAVLVSLDCSEQMTKALKLYKKGISEFVGLKECLTFITMKNPSEQTLSGHHEKSSLPIYRKAGKINVTTQNYMEFIEAAKPDVYVSMADGDTWMSCSKKRTIKSNERSEEMFEECIKYQKEMSLDSYKLIGTIEGGYNEFERKKCTDYVKKYDDVLAGYFIDGVHRNGSEATTVDSLKLKDIVNKTLSYLSNEKMKVMLGAYLPHIKLELMSLGVDVFDSSFVNLVTKMNRALTFSFDLQHPVSENEPEINLMDPKYKDDFSPFLKSCECLACKQHTKAYTNHLLVTKELLGPMLLTIHNLHHYTKFFEAIQESLKEDRFVELKDMIAMQYKNNNFSYSPQITEMKNKINAPQNK